MNLEPIKLAWWYFSYAFYFGYGSHKADQMHLDIIDAVLSELPAEVAETVRAQLAQRYFLSWMSDGRINVFFFFDEGGLPLLSSNAFQDRLFKVQVFVEEQKLMAHVSFYKGRIHCVELKKPRRFFKGKKFRVGSVKEGKPADSFTGVIDRAEHGKETDYNP